MVPQAFGHRNSSILNGGLPRWILEKREVEGGPLNEFQVCDRRQTCRRMLMCGSENRIPKTNVGHKYYPWFVDVFFPTSRFDKLTPYSSDYEQITKNVLASGSEVEIVLDARSRGR